MHPLPEHTGARLERVWRFSETAQSPPSVLCWSAFDAGELLCQMPLQRASEIARGHHRPCGHRKVSVSGFVRLLCRQNTRPIADYEFIPVYLLSKLKLVILVVMLNIFDDFPAYSIQNTRGSGIYDRHVFSNRISAWAFSNRISARTFTNRISAGTFHEMPLNLFPVMIVLKVGEIERKAVTYVPMLPCVRNNTALRRRMFRGVNS